MTVLLLLILPAVLQAGPAETIVERLIARAWLPDTVRVEWTFTGDVPEKLSNRSGWIIDSPLPERPAGSLIVRLRNSGADEIVSVSGRAKVSGNCSTVSRRIKAGNAVGIEDLTVSELDLTNLRDCLLPVEAIREGCVAARMLIPGRPLCVSDVRPVPVVMRGNNVSLCCQSGLVTVRMTGRALKDGAVGETIPVAVDVGKKKRFKGTVCPDGTVSIILN